MGQFQVSERRDMHAAIFLFVITGHIIQAIQANGGLRTYHCKKTCILAPTNDQLAQDWARKRSGIECGVECGMNAQHCRGYFYYKLSTKKYCQYFGTSIPELLVSACTAYANKCTDLSQPPIPATPKKPFTCTNLLLYREANTTFTSSEIENGVNGICNASTTKFWIGATDFSQKLIDGIRLTVRIWKGADFEETVYTSFGIKKQNYKLDTKGFSATSSFGSIGGNDIASSQFMNAYCGDSAWGYGFFDNPAKKTVENCKTAVVNPQFAFSSPSPTNVRLNYIEIFKQGYTGLALYEG